MGRYRCFASAGGGLVGTGNRCFASSQSHRHQSECCFVVLLEQLIAGEKLTDWAEGHRRRRPELAQEHRQLWTGFLQLLDELVIGLGDTTLTPAEYAEILASGLEGLRLGLVPPSLDQVLVGSLERSRHPNARAAFVLGVSEGVLPGRAREDAVFSDREREDLLAAGIELAPTSRVNQLHERYLTYIAPTRASERLWVSFPLADSGRQGFGTVPVLNRLREPFPAYRKIMSEWIQR